MLISKLLATLDRFQVVTVTSNTASTSEHELLMMYWLTENAVGLLLQYHDFKISLIFWNLVNIQS